VNSHPATPIGDMSAADETLPPLTEALSLVTRDFKERGALGCVFVDASALEEVEQLFGHEAYLRSMRTLGGIVRQVAEEALGTTGVVTRGELGRSEVFLLAARPPGDGEFYTRGLPGLTRLLRQRLERHGQRIVYPYLRRPPRLELGYGFTIRNSRFSPVTQVRNVIDESRGDAELNRRWVARDRRRRLLDVIVSGKVKSVYEPIVDSTTLTVFGYEALARGPENSELASPMVLFPLAHEEGLSFQLDCLCRQKAIEGAVDFPEGAKLFMNIRPSAIHDPSFQPDELTRTLAQCELSPSDVVFEISEQESFENYDILREARDEYGKLGFQFALDDTGAGYACLEAAMELAPDFLKVDRAFVSGVDEDQARQNMLLSFQSMAERMNAKIIGEGLDTMEELQMLAQLGISLGQGWLFGKATPLRAENGSGS
jgi:EAL domain-containing protein (putative c-di-GMP-specific phosphodiesterase class I)